MSALSAPTPEMLSIRAFAKRDGCDESRVRKAIRTGHLKLSAGMKLDAALVGTGWREMNRKAADTADKTLRTLATVRSPDAESVRTRIPAVCSEDCRPANYPEGMAALVRHTAVTVAAELIGRLPQPIVEGIVGRVVARAQLEAALTLNEEGMPLTAPYQSWTEHPDFTGPLLTSGDWNDAAMDAAERVQAAGDSAPDA